MGLRYCIIFSVFPVSALEKGADFMDTGLDMFEKARIHEPFWYFIYLFILLALYAWINIYYGNVLAQTFRASTNFTLSNKLFKDNSLLQSQLDGVLYLYYFLSVAFALYYLELKTGWMPYQLQGAWLFLFNFGLLALLFYGKVVFHNIAGFLFNGVKIIREYLYNMFLFNKLTGLVLLPLMFLMVYTRGVIQVLVLWTGILVLSGIFLMRFIRAIMFSYRKGLFNFYMFLYLCALEIVPFVLLYRWLEGVL